MRQVGGDFYDFYRMGDTRLGVIIGDVSGHGMPAALIGSMFKIAFSIFKNEPDVSVSLARINSALIDHVGRQFITANYMVIDARARTLVSSNAGHWPQIIRRGRDGSLVEVYNRNKAIGIVPDVLFGRTEYAIGDGDRIVLFTDGVIEAMNGHGELFGEERFKGMVRDCGGQNAEAFFDRVFDELHSWTGIKEGESFEDDICLLCIDVKGVNGSR
jgi:serine phosphatase RsbU (regulator of sigma subunit)